MAYRENDAPIQPSVLATVLILLTVLPIALLAEPLGGSGPQATTGSSAEFTPPALVVSADTEQLIQRLRARLAAAVDAGNLEEARTAADDLVSTCEMFLGSKAWQSVVAEHLRTEVNRMRCLSEKERKQVQEARASFQLAANRHCEGYPEEAKALATKAKLVQQQLLGPCSPSHLETLQLLIQISLVLKQASEGGRLALEMATICRQAYGVDSPRYADALCSLGALYASARIYDQAEVVLKQSAALRKRTQGDRSTAYASSLSSLGFLYCSRGEYKNAESVIREALTLCKELRLTLNPIYADCLQNLAVIYCRTEAYAEAEPLFREAVQTNEVFVSSRRHELIDTLRQFVVVLKKLGKVQEAKAYEERLQSLLGEDQAGGEGDMVAPGRGKTSDRSKPLVERSSSSD